MFSPLIISILGIIGSSLSILVYHFFVVKFCIRRQQTPANSNPQTNNIPTGGVEEKVLIAIPIFPFSNLRTKTDGECAVCLGELKDEDMVRLLPNCKHAFHVSCIDQWFAHHKNCPLCRSPITPQNDCDSNASSNSNSSAADDTVTVTSVAATESEDLTESGTINCTETSSSSSSGVNSFGLLRLCAAERKLKRSLSMDQSFLVIDLRRERDNSTTYTSVCELSRSKSYWTQYDRMSTKLMRSFSCLRIGKGNSSSTTTATILPY